MNYWQSVFDKGLTIYIKHQDLLEAVSRLSQNDMGPEIVFEDTTALLIISSKEVSDMRQALDDNDLPRSVHAPFFDLSIGSADQHIREYSAKCLKHGLETAEELGSELYIVHSGFWPMIPKDSAKIWINLFLQNLEKLIKKAQKLEITIALENVFEADIWLHQSVFNHFSPEELSFCFDLGHANCFAKNDPMEWIEAFHNRIVHLHLHDNDGSDDQHLPLGRGTVDFAGIFRKLEDYNVKPSINLEVEPSEASACMAFLQSLLLGETA